MGVSVGGRDDDGGIGREVVLGGLASLIASRPAFAGDGEAACKNDQTPDATKPALGGFCFASYLVGRGKLNWLSKVMIYLVNIFFRFLLEYHLEYRAKKLNLILSPILARARPIVKGVKV